MRSAVGERRAEASRARASQRREQNARSIFCGDGAAASASTRSAGSGETVPLRPNLGIFTQPISAIGLPVAAVPVFGEGLPIGVQVIAAPWREDLCLRAAFALEQAGVCVARPPAMR